MAVKIDEKTSELIFKMSDAFYSIFSEYNPPIIEQAMGVLNKEENKVISLFYGLDGEHCLDYDEIANKLGVSVDEVDEIIEKGINNLKNILISQKYNLKGVNTYNVLIEKHGQDNVINALEQLDEEYKILIKEYYVSNGMYSLNKLSKKYNMKVSTVYTKIKTGIKKISKIIENKMVNVFYSKFEGFSKEAVDLELDKIDRIDREIIKFHYGLEGKRKNISELSDIYNMSGQNIYHIINNNIDKILKNLNVSGKKVTVVRKHRTKENFYSKFDGCSVEQVDSALKKLNDKYIDMLVLYYGLNGKESKSTKEIGEILGYKTITVNNTVPRLIDKIKEIIENPTEYENNKFYDKFSGFNKEDVDNLLEKLDERSKGFIKLYYGLGCKKYTLKMIAEKYGCSVNCVCINIRKIEDKIKKCLSLNSDVIEVNRSRLNTSKHKKSLYDNFKEFSVEEVNNALLKLETRDREVVCSYYGINCERCTLKLIGEKYRLSTNYVWILIKKSEDKILKYLNGYIEETTKKVRDYKKKEVKLVEEPKIKEKEVSYREGNNKWLYEYLVHGDQKAYSKLVEKNMKLVNYIVQKYCKNVSEQDECFSIGCSGLLDAINTFDIEKIGKIQFSTYATVCIKNEIFMDFRKNGKHSSVEMFSDHIYGEDEKSTLEDTLASEDDFVEDMLDEESENYKKKKIYEVLNTFDARDRTIIEYLYGFKSDKPYTQSQVGNLVGISQSYVKRVADKLLSKLKSELDELQEEYVFSSEKDPNVQKMNDAFYSMFKGQDKKEVKKVLSKFRNKEYVYLYYGLDGKTCLDYDEIAYKFNIGIDEVDEKIENIINKLKKFYEGKKVGETYERVNLYRELIENYGIDRVNVALQNFTEKQKDMILDYYLHDLSVEKMIKKYNKTKGYIYTEVVRYVKKMEKYIQKELLTREEKFYELYEGYSKIEVNNVLNRLSDKEKDIISCNFVLNGKYLTGSQLAEKYNISPSYIALYINNLTVKIGGLLEENKEENKVLNKNDFYNKFKRYSEIQIDTALLELLEKDRELLNLYYGLKGKSYNVTYICNKLDIDKKDVYERIYKDISNLRGLLKNDKRIKSERKGREKKKVYEELASVYGKEAVLIALSKFSKEKQDIFKDYYGIETRVLGKQEIMDKYGIAVNTVYQRIDSISKKIKNYLENPSGGINLSRRHKFAQVFEKYDLTEVLKLINMLDNKTRDCMLYYYDLVEDGISQEELYEKYEIKSSGALYTFANRGTDKVLSVLSSGGQAINKKAGFYGSFVGYTKTQVNQAVDSLKAKDREFIKLFFGIGNVKKKDANQLKEKYGVTRQRVYYRKDKIIEKIAVILESKSFESKKDKFYKMFEGVEKAKVDEALDKLSSIEKDCISLYYGFNGKELTFRQIASKYGYNASSICAKNKASIEKIRKLIENPNSFLDKKTEFYSNFVSYSREDVNVAMSKLDKKDQEILSLYFGFNGNPMLQKDIAKQYNLTTGYISVNIKRTIKNILALLENPGLNLIDKKKNKYQNSVKDKRIEKYSLLIEKYGQDKVTEEISNLKDRDRGIVTDCFGVECEPLSSKEISSKYNINEKYVYTVSFQLLRKIERHLENPDKFNNRKGKFYDRFKGYSREEVDYVLSSLKPKNQELIKLYYGLEGNRETAKELAQRYGYTYSTGITKVVYREINKMLEKLNENDEKFYKLFEGHSKDEIDQTLSTLKEKHVCMIKDYYGVDCNRLNTVQIAKKYNISSPTYVSFCIREGIKELKRKLSNPQDINGVNKFYNLFKGYSKEQVNLAMEKLDDRSKNIIYMIYGFEKDSMTYKDVAEKLGLTMSQVNFIRNTSVKKTRNILEGKEVKKEKRTRRTRDFKFKKLIETYGEELVLEKMKELSDAERAFLVMYYTLGKVKKYELYEIAEKISVNEEELEILEDKILEKLNVLLNSKDKEEIIKEKRMEFLSQIKNTTYLKQAIESLPKGYKQLIALYYGLNGKDIMGIEELCERTNLNKEAILERISGAINKINNYIPTERR